MTDHDKTPTRVKDTEIHGWKRVIPRLVRMTAALTITAAISLIGTASSQAAVPHVNGFSPYISPNWAGPFRGDCWVYVGPAYDNWHTAFHFFGGGQVACNSYHNVAITVRQYRDINGPSVAGGVQEVGTPGAWGTYTTSNVFVPTGPACKGGYNNATFRTAVYATIDGYSPGWRYSTWQSAPGQGCLN
jgi:hypothetical protein